MVGAPQEMTPDDFNVVDTPRGKVIETVLKGVAIVFFHNPVSCEFFQELIPDITALAGNYGCPFGTFDIDKYKAHDVALTLQTKALPRTVIFVNGKPYMSYHGPPDAVELKLLIRGERRIE
jgi:thioredoxin-like negative regulator of GroEL